MKYNLHDFIERPGREEFLVITICRSETDRQQIAIEKQ